MAFVMVSITPPSMPLDAMWSAATWRRFGIDVMTSIQPASYRWESGIRPPHSKGFAILGLVLR